MQIPFHVHPVHAKQLHANPAMSSSVVHVKHTFVVKVSINVKAESFIHAAATAGGLVKHVPHRPMVQLHVMLQPVVVSPVTRTIVQAVQAVYTKTLAQT